MEALPRIKTLWDARNIQSIGFYGSLIAVLWRSSGLRRSTSSMDFAEVASISLPLLRRLGGNSCHTWLGLACDCHHQVSEHTRSAPSYYPASKSSSSTAAATSPAVFVSVAFLVLPFLAASNLLFYVGFVMAERVLYLPSVGYCLLFGHGFGSLWQRVHGSRRSRMLLLCGLGLLLGIHGLRTVRRNLDWRDEEQLFRSAISVNPPKGECCIMDAERSVLFALLHWLTWRMSNICGIFFRFYDYHTISFCKIFTFTLQVILLSFNFLYFPALGNLGSVLSSQGRYEEAEWALTTALRHRPSMADAHFNL